MTTICTRKNIVPKGLGTMSKKKDKIKEKIINAIIDHAVEVIIGGIGVFLATIITGAIFLYKIDSKIDNFGERLELIDGASKDSLLMRFNRLEATLNAQNKLPYEIESVQGNKKKSEYIKCNPTDSILQTMIANVSSQEVQDGQAVDCSEDAIIATDSASHRKYTRKNLQKKKILVPYMEDGQEVYFLGQFNEKGHWDGECTINVYIDNKLYLINDAEYNDGKLVKYNQVLDNDETWIIAKRKPKGNYNVGDSVTYRKKEKKEKKFTLESVESGDILSVNDFKDELKEKDLEGFYHGKTSGGTYDDQSGNAYMVKYDRKGIVRTIYVGRFKGGVFDDDTGQAWEIAKDEGDFQYVYFKGKFKNRVAQTTKTNSKKPISVKKIHKIIDKIKFKCSVDLYGDE